MPGHLYLEAQVRRGRNRPSKGTPIREKPSWMVIMATERPRKVSMYLDISFQVVSTTTELEAMFSNYLGERLPG